MSRSARLPAIGALVRGFVNLRANWEVVPAGVAQGLLATALSAAAFLPLALTLELPPLPDLGDPASDPHLAGMAWLEWLEALVLVLSDRGPAVIGALAACLVILTMAYLVYCFFQGGILGILVAGDRQAPPGRPPAWAWMRTFSLRHLAGWGGRFLWRYFWLVSLVLTVLLVELLLPFGLIALMAWGVERWGPGAMAGIGCGGGLLWGAVAMLTVCWGALATADAARDGSGVGAAARRGLDVLGARLGAVLLVTVLWLLALFALQLSLAPVSLIVEIGNVGAAAEVAIEALLLLVQWLFGSLLGLLYMATLVALVNDHQRRLEAAGGAP